MELIRNTVVTLGYGGATRRYYSDARVLLEKYCGGTRLPVGHQETL